MKALVFTAPGTVEVQDVPEPSVADGEVLLTVALSGICGSELHGVREPGFRRPPLVMGHEFGGTTADGNRVVVNPLVSCDSCDLCRRGLYALCRERSIVGIHRAGAFAERVSVPARNAYPLPDDMSWERAALVEPLANGVHAVGLLAQRPNRLGIVGGGTIGLVCLLVAMASGVEEVVVADLAPERLELAKRLGAASVTERLEPEFDAIIDAVGVAATRRASVDALRPGGTAVWVGLAHADAGIDATSLVRHEKRVLGSYCYTPGEFARALDLAHSVDLDWADTFPLTEGADVFTQLMNGRTDIIKALLRP